MADLRELSARIGRDPLLVQASSGNTSIKGGGVLWIKASGKWLSDAERDDVFVPVNVAEVKECLKRNGSLGAPPAGSSPNQMCASIETFMHAALPHRVVIHVHSVNTIAWAVRQDAPARLAERLSGLPWRWIPYMPSGLPLGREIERVAACHPGTDVLVLGNHGLVICGSDCDAAEELLAEVERRLAAGRRVAPEPKVALLAQLARVSRWRLPDENALHALGTDAVSRRILKGGVLYPCQAIFLGQTVPLMPCSVPFSEAGYGDRGQHGGRPFLIVEGCGVLISETITRAASAVLAGLAQVVQRIGGSAPVRYLMESDVTGILTGDGFRYRQAAEAGESRSVTSL